MPHDKLGPYTTCHVYEVHGETGCRFLPLWTFSPLPVSLRIPNKTDPDPLAEREFSSFERFCSRLLEFSDESPFGNREQAS